MDLVSNWKIICEREIVKEAKKLLETKAKTKQKQKKKKKKKKCILKIGTRRERIVLSA